jgi:hypothetical protein
VVPTGQGSLGIAGVNGSPVFWSITLHGRVRPGRLSGIDVARVGKKLAERPGLDQQYPRHSLRPGHATSAAMARRYILDGSQFRDISTGKLGLYRQTFTDLLIYLMCHLSGYPRSVQALLLETYDEPLVGAEHPGLLAKFRPRPPRSSLGELDNQLVHFARPFEVVGYRLSPVNLLSLAGPS